MIKEWADSAPILLLTEFDENWRVEGKEDYHEDGNSYHVAQTICALGQMTR